MHERITQQRKPTSASAAREPLAHDVCCMAGVSSLTTGCAHHLNNIVTTIVTATELALEDVEDGSEASGCLSLIREEAMRAANLVESLALFSEGSESAREEQNLATIVEETVGTLRRTLPEETTITYTSGDVEATVSGDARQLRRMIMALATNAHEAMPLDGELTIELTVEDGTAVDMPEGFPPGDYVRLTVTDNGVGMSSDVSDQVFYPFFTTKPTGTGTGLSMSEVYGIVRSHDGHVKIESAVGTGTTVTVYLPVITSVAPSRRRSAAKCEGGAEKLLLVDDDPGVLKVTRIVLNVLGYEVVTATNGVEALEVFAAEHEDTSLVLADLVMPKMDGAELCEELSKQYPGTKVLMVSGSVPEDPMPHLSDKGLVGFLRKPFTRNELATAVREALVDSPASTESVGAIASS